MPRGDPFSELCRLSARLSQGIVADLHIHTNASDGDWTPSQVLAHAQTRRLNAIAISDHDTMTGYRAAACLMNTSEVSLRLIPAVECSAMWRDHEIHVLAYGIHDPTDEFRQSLDRVCQSRLVRFQALIGFLECQNVQFHDSIVDNLISRTASLGRRHAAKLLVQSGHASSNYDAFRRWIHPAGSYIPQKHLPELADVTRMISESGGISSIAHPPSEWRYQDFQELKELNLNAIEVSFPAVTHSRSQELRTIANRLNLAITGGSDSHGSDRKLGSHGLTNVELAILPKFSITC